MCAGCRRRSAAGRECATFRCRGSAGAASRRAARPAMPRIPGRRRKVAEFHKLIANVREALERHGAPAHNGAHSSAAAVPTTGAVRRVELTSQFARELHALGGHFLGLLTPRQTVPRILEVAAALKARSVAVGAGIVNDPAPIIRALELTGANIIRTAGVTDDVARA